MAAKRKKDLLGELVKMREYLHQGRSQWMNDWQGAVDWVIPNHGNIYSGNTSGRQNQPPDYTHLLDGVAVRANNRLGPSLNSQINGKGIPWFMFGLADTNKMERESVKKSIGLAEGKLRKKLGVSNFYKEMASMWLDIPSVCSSVLYFDNIDKSNRFRFKNYPVWQFDFSEDEWGAVDFGFLELKMSAWSIAQKWEAARENKKFAEALEKNPFQEFSVLHCVGKWDYLAEDQMADRRNEHFSIWILNAGEKNGRVHLNPADKRKRKYQGYRTMPYFVGRYQRMSSSELGVGPGLQVVSDMRVLAQTIYWKLQGIPLSILPPYMTDDGEVRIGTNGEIEPGTQILLSSSSARFEPYLTGSNLRLAEIDIQQQRELVKEGFHWNDLLVYPDRPEMTTTEFMRRLLIANRLFSPTAELVQQDVLDGVIFRALDLMEANGEIDFPQEIAEEEMEFRYVGPLAKAAELPEVLAARDHVNTLIQIATTAGKPELLEKIKWEEFIMDDAEKTGVPLELLLSRAEFKKVRDAMLERANQQAELDSAKTGAEALQAGGKGVQALQN